MKNPWREWQRLREWDARIAERADQQIAWDRFVAGHQDSEIEDPEPGAEL